MRKSLLVIAALILILAVQSARAQSGREAPDFTLEDLDGDWVSLQDVVGDGPLLISFWATWCRPCLEELRELQILFEEYEPRGLTMLAISTDSERSIAKVKPLVRSKGYTFCVLLDTNSDVARLYYAQNIPYTVIIDSAGSIVYTHMGYRKGDELEVREVIDGLLGD
jgi:cytochrome c biogenesis protein CcmG/thiol:disulfide interchange protein DsbE